MLEPEISAGRPRIVAETDFDIYSEQGWHSYDISPDGERFLMVRSPKEEQEAPRLVYVQNWFEELEQLMAEKH